MTSSAVPKLATASRWTARALSILILGFWGYFIVAHLLGDAGHSSRPLELTDYLALAAMGCWLAGLVVAWRLELFGGFVTLAALLLGVGINPGVIHFPGMLVGVAGVLFLVSGWMRRPAAGAARTDQT